MPSAGAVLSVYEYDGTFYVFFGSDSCQPLMPFTIARSLSTSNPNLR